MLKKILVISDTHERYDTIEQIIKTEADSDLIIHSGDFSNIDGRDSSAESQSHALDAFKHTIGILKSMNKPIICIPGNHDTTQLFHHLNPDIQPEEGVYLLGSGPIIVENLRFLGLGGAPPVLMPDGSIKAVGYPYKDNTECDLAVETLLAPHFNGEKTIMITHFPPFEFGKILIGDITGDAGNPGLHELIVKNSDQLIMTINGHLHLQRWNEDYFGTKALNPGCVKKGLYAVVYLEINDIPKVQRVEMKNA